MSTERLYFLDFLQYKIDFSISVDYNNVKAKGGLKMFQYYKLFDYMRKNDIRQKDLLDKKIISNGTLQKLRNNENVNTSVLAALCDYLKCDITDIMEYVQPNEKEQ